MDGYIVIIHDTIIVAKYERAADADAFIEGVRQTDSFKDNPEGVYKMEDTEANRAYLAEYEVHQGRFNYAYPERGGKPA